MRGVGRYDADLGDLPERADAQFRGIDRIAAVNAWVAVERRLDRGPRARVFRRLEQRRTYLAENGEHPVDIRAAFNEGPSNVRPALRFEHSQREAVETDGGDTDGGGDLLDAIEQKVGERESSTS